MLQPNALGTNLTLSGLLDVAQAKVTGLNVGTDAKLIGTLDGAIRMSSGTEANWLGYGLAGYVPSKYDSTSHTFKVAGVNRLVIDTTIMYPATNQGMHIGKATNFFSGGWFNSLVVGAPNNSSAGDGQILIGDTTAGYLTAYHSGTFKPLYLDGSTLTVRYAGNAKLTFDGNMGTGGSLYPTFDGPANLGTNANKFAFVKTVEAFTTSRHLLS